MSPSMKVIFATIAGLLASAAVVISDNGVPKTAGEWLALLAKVLGTSGAVGGAGYLKAENRPSPSAIAAVRRQS